MRESEGAKWEAGGGPTSSGKHSYWRTDGCMLGEIIPSMIPDLSRIKVNVVRLPLRVNKNSNDNRFQSVCGSRPN